MSNKYLGLPKQSKFLVRRGAVLLYHGSWWQFQYVRLTEWLNPPTVENR